MKSIFKKFIVSVATVICTVCAFAGAFVSFNDDKSVVNAETTIAERDFWVSEAEIRLINDEHGAGIRFHTYMTKTEYDDLTVTSSGTLMIPEHLYDGELTLEDSATTTPSNVRAVHADTTGKWESVTYTDKNGETTDVQKSTAYIYNLPAKGFGWRMVVRSYVELDDGSVVYSASAKASISDVASAVKNDESITDEHLKFQVEPFIVETVDVTIVDLYGNAKTSAVAYGSKLVVPETCQINTGSAFEVNFYDANDKKWDVTNGEFTRDETLTAKMEQKIQTVTVANTFLSTNSASKYVKVIPNDDLNGETAPAGFTKITRFDPKTQQNAVDTTAYSDVWASGGLGSNHFNISVSKYSEVSFALKLLDGAYLSNMKGWYSFSSTDWIYFHLTQNDDATWNIKITSGGEVITLKDSNGNTQEGSFTNQNSTVISSDASNRPTGSISTIIYDNGSSSTDGAGITIYGPGTVYSTEIIGVEKLAPENYIAYDAEKVVDTFFYGDTNVSWRNFKTGVVTTEVDAPEGFNVVTKFEVKDGVKEDDDGKNITLSGTYWDQTTYENYSEVWFAVKGTDLKTNKLPNYDQKVWTDWVYFHLTQTSAGVWTIEVTVNGEQLYLAENQVATETDSYQPAGSLQAILTGAFASNADGFAIRIEINGSDAVFYTTEVLAVGELGSPEKPAFDAGVVATTARGTWYSTNVVDNNDVDVAIDGFSYVTRVDSSTGWASSQGVLSANTSFNTALALTDYKEVWFAYRFVNCQLQYYPTYGNIVGDQTVYFHLVQTGTDADTGATLWTIEIANEAGTIVGTYTNQLGISSQIGTANSIGAILHNGFNSSTVTDGSDFRIRRNANTDVASIYATEVKAIRVDGGAIEDVELPSQGGSTTEEETASYKVKLIDSAAGAWLGSNLVVNADTSAVTVADGFNKVTRYDAGSNWTGTLSEVSSFNGSMKLDGYSEVWFAYKFVNARVQVNYSTAEYFNNGDWVYFHLTQTGTHETTGLPLWTIEITYEGAVWNTYTNQVSGHGTTTYDNTLTAILYSGGSYNKATVGDDGTGIRVLKVADNHAIYATEILAKPKDSEAKAMPSSTVAIMDSPVRTDFTSAQSSYAQITKNTELGDVTAPAGFNTVTRLDAMAKWSTSNAVLSTGANSWVKNDFSAYGEIWFAMKGDNVSFALDTSNDVFTDGWVLYRLTQTADGVWTVEMSIDGNSLATAEKTVTANYLYDFGVRVKALADAGVSLYVTEVRATQKTWGQRVIWSAMDYSKPSTALEAPYGFSQVYERTNFNDYFAKMDLSNTEYTQLRFGMLHSGNLYVDEGRTRNISTNLSNTTTMYIVTLDRTADGWTVTMNCKTYSSSDGLGSLSVWTFDSTGNSLYEIFQHFNVWSSMPTVYTTEVRGSDNHTHAHDHYTSNGTTHSSICWCNETIATETCSGGTATCTAPATCSVCGNSYGTVNAENHTQDKATIVNGNDTHTIKYLCCEEVVETTSCSGGTADCDNLAVCSVCGDTYGELGHVAGAWDKGEQKCTECGEVLDTIRELVTVSGLENGVFKTGSYLKAGDAYTGAMPEGFETVTVYQGNIKANAALGKNNWITTSLSDYYKVNFAIKATSGVRLQKRSNWSAVITMNESTWVYFTMTQTDSNVWTIEITDGTNTYTYTERKSSDGSIYEALYYGWTTYATEGIDAYRISLNTAVDTDGNYDWTTETLYSTEVLAYKAHDHFVDYYVVNGNGTHDGVCFCGYIVEDNVACSGDADDGCDIVCENCNTVYSEEHVGTLAWNEYNQYVCSECDKVVASVTTELGTQYFVLNTDASSMIALTGTYRGGTTPINVAEAFSDDSYTIKSATFNGTSTTATKGDDGTFDVKISKAGITNSIYGEGYEVTLTVTFYGEEFTITAPVIVVTNMITTDAGMQYMRYVLRGTDLTATATADNSMMGKGYYLLGANVSLTKDIIYTFGTYTAPFEGTFDGNGYTLSNYNNLQWFSEADYKFQEEYEDYYTNSDGEKVTVNTYQQFLEGSFFGVLNGTVKNVAFTGVYVSLYANLVHSGTGTVENVYVTPYIQTHWSSTGLSSTAYSSLFFTKGDRANAGTLRNVVVDFRGQAYGKLHDWWYANDTFGAAAEGSGSLFPAAIGTAFKAQNVAVYGFPYDWATASAGNVYQKKSKVATDGRDAGIYATYANLDGTARAEGEPTDNGGYFAISQLDESIWKVVGGIPVLKNVSSNAITGSVTDIDPYPPASSPDNVIYNSANGTTEYYVAWDWATANQTTFDAYALISNYAYLSTGAGLKAGTLDVESEGYKQIIVGTYAQYGEYLDNTLTVAEDTRANYGIYVENRTIYVLGETDEAIMYAAKALANKLYGFREVAADDYVYDDLKSSTITMIEDYETAIAFAVRGGGSILPTANGAPTDTIDQNKMGFTTAGAYTSYLEMHNALNYFYDFSSGSAVVKSGYTDLGGTTSQISSSSTPTETDAQLCYLRDLDKKATWVASVIQAQYNADTSMKVINFMIEDNSSYCTCTTCSKFSNPSIPQLIFLNEVAKKLDTLGVPVAIEFFAYNQFQSSPVLTTADTKALSDLGISYDTATVTYRDSTTATVLKAHEDLRLEWTSHKLYHSFDLTDDMNQEFYDYLLGWIATMGDGSKIDLFLYETFYRDYFLPMNTWKYQVSWYKTFNELGINNYVSNLGVTAWTVNGSRNAPNTQTSFNAFKTFINARVQTDINVTYEQLKAEFFSTTGYYGAGGPTMLKYFEELEASMEARKTGGTNPVYSGTIPHWTELEQMYSVDDGYGTRWRQANFNGFYNMNVRAFVFGDSSGQTVTPSQDLYTTGSLTQQQTLEQWYTYCQTALGLVDADSVYARRIKVEALFPEYAYLYLGTKYKGITESKMTEGTGSVTATANYSGDVIKTQDSDVSHYQDFYNRVKAIGVVRLAEFYTLDSKTKPTDTTYKGYAINNGLIDYYLYASPFKNWGVTF